MKYILPILLAVAVFPVKLPHNTAPKVKPFARVNQKELTCLAKNIYYEAPAESYEGKLAVATVTMNRVRSNGFPKSVCGVVYQRNRVGCQFSWTCGSRAKFNSQLYDRAYAVAKQVLTANVRHDKLKNALYFHNTTVTPNWTFAKPVVQIDNHIFYEPKKIRSRRT
jgi:spore germination cell wall hydrolase CwlJ-like protein